MHWDSTLGNYSEVNLPTPTRANGTATANVYFNANGGTVAPTSLSSTATVTYSCAGWFTNTTGGTKRGNAGGSYTPPATETLYAQ